MSINLALIWLAIYLICYVDLIQGESVASTVGSELALINEGVYTAISASIPLTRSVVAQFQFLSGLSDSTYPNGYPTADFEKSSQIISTSTQQTLWAVFQAATISTDTIDTLGISLTTNSGNYLQYNSIDEALQGIVLKNNSDVCLVSASVMTFA